MLSLAPSSFEASMMAREQASGSAASGETRGQALSEAQRGAGVRPSDNGHHPTAGSSPSPPRAPAPSAERSGAKAPHEGSGGRDRNAVPPAPHPPAPGGRSEAPKPHTAHHRLSVSASSERRHGSGGGGRVRRPKRRLASVRRLFAAQHELYQIAANSIAAHEQRRADALLPSAARAARPPRPPAAPATTVTPGNAAQSPSSSSSSSGHSASSPQPQPATTTATTAAAAAAASALLLLPSQTSSPRDSLCEEETKITLPPHRPYVKELETRLQAINRCHWAAKRVPTATAAAAAARVSSSCASGKARNSGSVYPAVKVRFPLPVQSLSDSPSPSPHEEHITPACHPSHPSRGKQQKPQEAGRGTAKPSSLSLSSSVTASVKPQSLFTGGRPVSKGACRIIEGYGTLLQLLATVRESLARVRERQRALDTQRERFKKELHGVLYGPEDKEAASGRPSSSSSSSSCSSGALRDVSPIGSPGGAWMNAQGAPDIAAGQSKANLLLSPASKEVDALSAPLLQPTTEADVWSAIAAAKEVIVEASKCTYGCTETAADTVDDNDNDNGGGDRHSLRSLRDSTTTATMPGDADAEHDGEVDERDRHRHRDAVAVARRRQLHQEERQFFLQRMLLSLPDALMRTVDTGGGVVGQGFAEECLAAHDDAARIKHGFTPGEAKAILAKVTASRNKDKERRRHARGAAAEAAAAHPRAHREKDKAGDTPHCGEDEGNEDGDGSGSDGSTEDDAFPFTAEDIFNGVMADRDFNNRRWEAVSRRRTQRGDGGGAVPTEEEAATVAKRLQRYRQEEQEVYTREGPPITPVDTFASSLGSEGFMAALVHLYKARDSAREAHRETMKEQLQASLKFVYEEEIKSMEMQLRHAQSKVALTEAKAVLQSAVDAAKAKNRALQERVVLLDNLANHEQWALRRVEVVYEVNRGVHERVMDAMMTTTTTTTTTKTAASAPKAEEVLEETPHPVTATKVKARAKAKVELDDEVSICRAAIARFTKHKERQGQTRPSSGAALLSSNDKNGGVRGPRTFEEFLILERTKRREEAERRRLQRENAGRWTYAPASPSALSSGAAHRGRWARMFQPAAPPPPTQREPPSQQPVCLTPRRPATATQKPLSLVPFATKDRRPASASAAVSLRLRPRAAPAIPPELPPAAFRSSHHVEQHRQ